MKIKTVYIAEDGKEFDNPKECADYEDTEMPIVHCGFMTCMNGITQDLSEVDFIYFNEPAEMKNFISISERLNFPIKGLPDRPSAGYFIWDYYSLRWYQLPDHLGDILYNHYKNK